MNIVITLTKRVAQLIYEGKMTIMLRKSMPIEFKLFFGSVYICEKESCKVTGVFTIDKIVISTFKKEIWGYYAEELAMKKKDYDKYTAKDRNYFLWHITMPLQFKTHYSLQDVFHMDEPPLSYAYTDVDWHLDKIWEPVIDVEQKKAVQ